MEIDALALVIIVIAVALTTFVFTFLAKFCFEKYVDIETDRRRGGRRSSRFRRHTCNCHRCPSQTQCSKRSSKRNQDQVAINLCKVPTEEDIKIRTFAPSSLAPPVDHGNNNNENASPSETFARLGMRSSKDSKNFDFDRHLQLANTSSSEIKISKYFNF